VAFLNVTGQSKTMQNRAFFSPVTIHMDVAVEDPPAASKDVNLSLGNVCHPIVAKIYNW